MSKTKQNPLRPLVADLRNLGFGSDDSAIEGADTVDTINEHWPALTKAAGKLPEPGIDDVDEFIHSLPLDPNDGRRILPDHTSWQESTLRQMLVPFADWLRRPEAEPADDTGKLRPFLCSYAYDMTHFVDFIVEARSTTEANRLINEALEAGRFSGVEGEAYPDNVHGDRCFVQHEADEDTANTYNSMEDIIKQSQLSL